MPNADTHIPVGVASGAVMAITRVPSGADGYQATIETLGGMLGGLIGAKMPDIIDPATCPNHRGFGHGMFNALTAGKLYLKKLPQWQAEFREKANSYEAMAQAEQDGFKRFLLVAKSILCLAIAGLLAGLFAGYASHLALDFTTPKGLPLLYRGF